MRATLARLSKSRWCLALVIILAFTLVPLANELTDDDERVLPSTTPAVPTVMPLPLITGDERQNRGRVVRWERYDPPFDGDEPVLGEAWRAVYTSVSGLDGRSREVSGAFFVPRAAPPENGWPVVSLAHGTTGIGRDCGPSQERDLLGYLPIVETFLAHNFAVALSDFEGLGDTGVHPYLEPRTAAFNTVDAVRALRDISPDVSTQWVAVGYSQGGQAAWAANELNSFYGEGLQLLGTIAIAPAANVTGVVDLIWSRSLTDEQGALLPLLTTGLLRYSPDLDEQVFRPAVANPEWLSCRASGSRSANSESISEHVVAGTELLATQSYDSAALREELRDALRRVALPQQPLSGPMLVVTGGRDSLILPHWVEFAVSQSCELGGRVDYLEVPGADHRNILWASGQVVTHWIAARFAGLPASSNCPEGG